jgi:hypothetical protein
VVDFFTTGDMLFGLYEDGFRIYGVDPVDDEVEAYYFDGTYYGSLPLDYSASPFPWGMCLDPLTATFYTDYSTNSIWFTDGSGWDSFVDPAGLWGRALDWDGQYIWESDCDFGGAGNGVYRFSSDGTGAIFFATPEPADYLTGLARFTFDGTEYVMVTTLQDHNFYFYGTDGTYAGSVAVPMTIQYGYGLEYCEARDSFFFSCVSYGNYCIYELDFDFQSDLDCSTFGGIKASFRD